MQAKEFSIGDVVCNASDDEELTLSIRCQEWRIGNADESILKPVDIDMWIRIEKVLNDNSEFIFSDTKEDDDEDPDDTVECPACSRAGGADLPVYHSPPVCSDD